MFVPLCGLSRALYAHRMIEDDEHGRFSFFATIGRRGV
jgi:MFS-type transporter involved in bile tolerance (Atg22 family)